MKIRHGVIISIALLIGLAILGGEYLPIEIQLKEMLITVFFILWAVSLGLIVYLIIRSIFRVIKGTTLGGGAKK